MPEQKMVDIDTSGNPVDVDIKEEQKQDEVEVQEEQESSVREVKAEQKEEQSNEEDLNEYSDSVKKRIDKLTAKMREAERREKAASEYADGIKKQYRDLDKKYKDLDTGYLNEFKNRVEISKAALQDRYQKAVADNDVKAQVEAQEELTKLTIETVQKQKKGQRLKHQMLLKLPQLHLIHVQKNGLMIIHGLVMMRP